MLPDGRNLLTLSRLSHVWPQSAHESYHDTLQYIHSHFTVYSTHFNALCFALLICNAHILFAHTLHPCMYVHAWIYRFIILYNIRRILVHNDRFIGWQISASYRFPSHPCGLTIRFWPCSLPGLSLYLLCTHTCMHKIMYVRTHIYIARTYVSVNFMYSMCIIYTT